MTNNSIAVVLKFHNEDQLGRIVGILERELTALDYKVQHNSLVGENMAHYCRLLIAL